MLDKMTEEVNRSLKVALSWASSAKNSLQNHYGCSPNQLVFGCNPNIPTVFNSDLPALEGLTSNQLIVDHLNAMHAARKAFISAEASDKLRRALRRQSRTATSLIYGLGDQVYYRRNDSKRCRGSGTVIGEENKQIFVKHGGIYLRVNPCHVRAAGDKRKRLNTNKDLCEQGKSLVTEKEVDSTKEKTTDRG